MGEISNINVNGLDYDLKDKKAREAVNNIPDTVEEAVEKYLTENPPSGDVSTEKIQNAVTEYLTENPPSGVTEEEVRTAVSACLEENAESFKGEQGEPGENGVTPNLTIGTVETLAAGSNATASITGTKEEPVLNLGIPKGEKGTSGSGGEGGGTTYYYKPVVISTTAGKYWKKDGTLGDSTEETDTYIKKVSATNLEQCVTVAEGEVYRLTVGSIGAIPTSFNATQCVFLNNNNEFVANAFNTSNYKEEELVTVPDGAAKMHFTVWSGAYPIIEKQVTEPCVINEFEVQNFINKMNEIPRKTYAPFDKAYISFINDDSLAITSELADLFEKKEIPLCFATIYTNLNNLATTGTVLDAVKKCVKNGGEVLSHAPNPITADTIDDFDTMYKQFAKSKEMLELYGFDVNGIILAGGSGQIAGNPKTERWARAYYQYSDLYGNSEYGYPYYHYRVGLSNHTLESAKALVDKAIENKEWVAFYLHTWSEFSKEDLTALIDYVKKKDSRELEVVTYKELYDKFVVNRAKEIVTITAKKLTTMYEMKSTVAIDDITVTAYYSDGSVEEITSNIIVDLTGVDNATVGNYWIKVTYGGKSAYIPLTIFSSADRVVLYSGKEGSYITWELYNDGVMELTNTATWKQNIQSYIDGQQPWYTHMNLIKKVKINAGKAVIGSIGEYAFYGATNLSEVDFSETGEVTLSAYSFANCGFTTPIISNIYSVATNAFNGCPVTEITIDTSVLTYNAFSGCNELKVVRFTKSNMTIDAGAFNANKGVITDIYVPWEEGAVANAPWGATGATIHYSCAGE